MKDILGEIIAHKKVEVINRKSIIPFNHLERLIEQMPIVHHSLFNALSNSSTGIISEFKRKSPSKGFINKNARIEDIVPAYENNGAAALSILTDKMFFGGTLDDLRLARNVASIPVMRKEFIISEYQIMEAKAAGADAILLIAAAISKDECRRFTKLADELYLEVLLELHDESEIEYVSPMNRLIGINNRNLGTFVTDIQKSFRMIELLPMDALLVSESGISSPVIVHELRDAGYKGFLIGENFMKESDPGRSLGNFINELALL